MTLLLIWPERILSIGIPAEVTRKRQNYLGTRTFEKTMRQPSHWFCEKEKKFLMTYFTKEKGFFSVQKEIWQENRSKLAVNIYALQRMQKMTVVLIGQVIYRCKKCCTLKPERAHHCSVCERYKKNFFCIKKRKVELESVFFQIWRVFLIFKVVSFCNIKITWITNHIRIKWNRVQGFSVMEVWIVWDQFSWETVVGLEKKDEFYCK